jgi:hypothetical protein
VSLPEDALRDVTLKTLADDVTEAITAGRAVLKAVMAEQGIKSLSAKLPDGTPVATLTLAGGNSTPRITDEAKFLAWVAEVHPTETETIVRPGYTEALLKAMKETGRAVDPKTGEVVPGVEFADTKPYITPSFSKTGVGGRELIRRAWRDGAISLPSLLELPSGSEDGGAPDAA